MGLKISVTGLIFTLLLIVPGMLKGSKHDPPVWIKGFILIPGGLGFVAVFLGLLLAVWGI